MNGILVHGVPGSPFLRSVEIALKEKGAPYRLQVMTPADMRTPQHLSLHPFGRIPMFEHDGFRLYETQAIVRYVDEAFPNPPLMPGNAQRRARMNQILGINDWYLFPKVQAPIGFNRIIGPKLLGLPADEGAITDALPMARTCFAELERLLGDQPYLTGPEVTIADIMVGAQLDLLSHTPEGADLLSGTRLEPWLDRLRARPSFIATQPPEALRAAA